MDMNFPLMYKVNVRSKIGNKSLYVTKNCLANHILGEMTRIFANFDTYASLPRYIQRKAGRNGKLHFFVPNTSCDSCFSSCLLNYF